MIAQTNTILALIASLSSVSYASQILDGPNIKTFGYEKTYASSDGNIGFTGDANFDLGASYELPVYTREQYYIARQRLNFFLGGRQEIALTFYIVRLNLLFDVFPYELIYENFFSYDLLDSGSKCWAGFRYSDILRL